MEAICSRRKLPLKISRAGFWGPKKISALRAGMLYFLQNPLKKSRASRGMLYFLQNPQNFSPGRYYFLQKSLKIIQGGNFEGGVIITTPR